MTETTNAGVKDYTPAELAREIAGIIRTRTDRWGQCSWFNLPNWPREDGTDYWEGRDLLPIPVEKVRESLKPGSTCNSTACVAGWAAILTSPAGTVIVDQYFIRLPGSDVKESLEYQGREALNLGRWQADWLFEGDRTREQVLAALDAIAAGEDWEPDHFDALGDPDDEDGPWDPWDAGDEDD